MYLPCVTVAALFTVLIASPAFSFPFSPPPLAGPGLGFIGPPPPLMFPHLQSPRPRRILIIRPPPGAHFPFSDHPMRLGFQPLPHRLFIQRPGPFRPPLPRRRLSREDDIVRHMASKYGYRRSGFYPGGPSRRLGYRRSRDRSSSRTRDFSQPHYSGQGRYHDSLDRYSNVDLGAQGDFRFPDRNFGSMRTYRDRYTGTRSRSSSRRGYLQRQTPEFGQSMSDPRRGYLSEFGKRSPFRSTERLRAPTRPRIYTRPSNLRPSLHGRIIQDISRSFSDNVKSGVSSSFDRNVLDLSKTRSIPVDRSPVSSSAVFDGAVDLTKVNSPVKPPVDKPPIVKPQPKPIPGRKVKKTINKGKGKKKPKITKQRNKPTKVGVKKPFSRKGAKTVVKTITKQAPLSKAAPIKIPTKDAKKLSVKPPPVVTKPKAVIPPPHEPKVIPKLDAVVPPVNSGITQTVVVDTAPKAGAGIDTQSSLTLDTVVNLHSTKHKIDSAGPANLLATSQSLNVDPLAPGVSIVELGPGGSTSSVLSGSDLTGLGNVDVLTLSTEGFAALEKAIQSGKTISADVLDSIIGKGGASGTTGIGKGEPAPEIVVIDHPTAGHESGTDTSPPGSSPKVINNNPSLPPIAQATKVISTELTGHKTAPLDISNYPESARHAILDLSVPMLDGQQHSPHSVDGVGIVGDSVGSVEAKGSNDLLGIFAVPSGSKFPKVPKSVSSIPSSIGKLLTGGTNDHTAHTTH